MLCLRHRMIFYLGTLLISGCVCVCVYMHTHVCMCACVCTAVCMCICVFLVQNIAGWCMSVSLFAYVCMLTAFTRHFPCCKTWWIKNLNLNYALLCQCFVGRCLSFSACCLLFLCTFSVVPSPPCPHTVSDPSPQPPLCCSWTCCGRFPFCVAEPCIDFLIIIFYCFQPENKWDKLPEWSLLILLGNPHEGVLLEGQQGGEVQ